MATSRRRRRAASTATASGSGVRLMRGSLWSRRRTIRPGRREVRRRLVRHGRRGRAWRSRSLGQCARRWPCMPGACCVSNCVCDGVCDGGCDGVAAVCGEQVGDDLDDLFGQHRGSCGGALADELLGRRSQREEISLGVGARPGSSRCWLAYCRIVLSAITAASPGAS